MVHTVYFSPSGTTNETLKLFAESFCDEYFGHDLSLPSSSLPSFEKDDVVVIAMPVYAGRLPSVASDRFQRIVGCGQKAVVMVVYGNRDYDDALLELCDLTIRQGFDVVAAGAFIGEHCIFPKVATGRPDSGDREKIGEFARLCRRAIAAGCSLNPDTVKGKRPYKKIMNVPLHPRVDRKKCRKCGVCADMCPVGAIDKDNPATTDTSKCITCCRCLHVCPDGARSLGGLLYKAAGWKFVKDNSRRREAEWFVGEL